MSDFSDPTASFSPSDAHTVTGPGGQLVHAAALAHSDRFERKLWAVRPDTGCMVGNGLSNQTFVEGPQGVIAIDTGESVEEMDAALAELQTVTDSPVVAVLYTHSHYVGGTAALPDGLPIYGHERIVANLRSYGAEFSPAAGRGLVHQFGITLPESGEDGIVNVGLGTEFRSRDHHPFTAGFREPTEVIGEATQCDVAGLTVEFTPAPSDSDDSLTIWFPELGLAVNNLVWPTLFNVFAIRGEQYRDPRVVLNGIDHLKSLEPEYLVGAHGPPLTGRERLQRDITMYRDSIQFLWDQTVRGINKGLTANELTRFVQLPQVFGESYLTTQFYGVAEHHVRQIHAGLRGWFDGDTSQLFPLHPQDRAGRLIQGFGGIEEVQRQADEALRADDVRWALELSSWLSSAEGIHETLTATLRTIARRTTAANIRNWCLTKARDLDGQDDLSRFGTHRFNAAQVANNPPDTYVAALRVLIDPLAAGQKSLRLRWDFADRVSVALEIRNGVAVVVEPEDSDNRLQLDLETWGQILANKQTVVEAEQSGSLVIQGERGNVQEFLRCVDHHNLSTTEL